MKLDVGGQHHGQVLLGHWHGTAFITVDNGDGCAPVALTGYTPVAQAEVNGALSLVIALQSVGNGIKGRLKGQAIKLTRVDQHPFSGKGGLAQIALFIFFGGNNLGNGQAVFGGKLPVALVVAWN